MNHFNVILQFLLVTSLKTTCILAFTFVGLWLLRNNSASLRHWLLNISLMAILALPVFTWLMPAWSLAVLPENPPANTLTANPSKPFDEIQKLKGENAAGTKSVVPSTTEVKKLAASTTVFTPTLQPVSLPSAGAATSALLGLQGWLFLLWCAGVVVSLIRALWQIFAVERVSRRNSIADNEWTALLDTECQFLGLKRQVTLRFSPQVQIPMTWGLWKPVILLPVEANNWDIERRRVVLLHELAHIVRWDYLSQWGTVVCCALNWFNPLVWKAARQAAIEREKSCDDLVLSTGIRGTDYARHLLDIAYTTVSQRAFLVMGLAMARRSGLEIRIRGILNAGQKRKAHPRLRALLLMTLLVLLVPLSGMHLERAAAQTDSITLSIAVSDPSDSIKNVLKDFEAQHPNIHVEVVDMTRIPDAADGLAAHFTAMESYANSADVLFIEGYNLSLTPFDTRAGYILDMSPLINGDAQFPTDDFYPQMWTSFQWDNGIWGIPLGADGVILNYNKAAFDKANIAYPTGNWTMTDWANAATQLTQKDANGNVIGSGFANSGRIFRESIWRTFFDSDAVDANVFPNAPQFDRTDIKTAMETYHQLETQGAISSDTNSAAMFVDAARKRPQDNYGWSLLPGNHMVTLPFGIAISAGTEHPELAYELVKFLSGQADLSGGIPARKSLTPPEGVGNSVMADYRPLIEQGFENSLNYANLRFTDYLNAAWGFASSQNASVQDAMQAAENHITTDIQTADAKHGQLTLAVSEPAVPVLAAGKIALNFDMVATEQPLANKQQWDQLIQDFTNSDPLVGMVNLRVVSEPASMAAASSDCFYYPENAVATANATLLPLDPLLTADSTFDRSDFIGNVLAASQYDTKTYALPLTIEPFVLRYSADRFAAANLPQPSNTWKVEDFTNALAALNPHIQGQEPFVDNGSAGTYLLALIAAYGGLPLDYRTDPPTIQFTGPTSVTAIQQVLDLVKNGDMRYSPLGNLDGGNAVAPNDTTAIYPALLNGLGRKIPRGSTPDKAVLFPSGRTFNGIAYNLGGLYISAKAQNPEACYRWMNTISQHPELFQSMPARTSQLNAAPFQAVTNPDVVPLYNQVATLLADPNTIAFPVEERGVVSISNFLLEHWLYEAFDDYVLNNGDLTTDLSSAQTYAQAYQTCAAGLPPFDVGSVKDSDTSAVIPYVDCAEHADGRLKPILDPLVGR